MHFVHKHRHTARPGIEVEKDEIVNGYVIRFYSQKYLKVWAEGAALDTMH